MQNYNIYTPTEAEKYHVMELVRSAGGKITSVSGCGSGYYITLDATPAQVHEINKQLGGVPA